MKPLIPMEPINCESIPQGPDWIAQVKWDGVRVLAYYDGQQTRLYNRRLHERTYHYPEMTDMREYGRVRSVIFDGEVIALGADGKPSFREVMRRDGIRRLEKVRQVQQAVPVTYMIFDVLFVDEAWITDYPFEERFRILSEIVVPNDRIQLVSCQPNGHALFDVIRQHGLEGIVMKNVHSKYVIGGKEKAWQKKKNYQDTIAVVGGVTIRDNVVNSLLLGHYRADGALHYIGHAGAGTLTRQDWLALTERIIPLVRQEMPFLHKPARAKEAIWLLPQLAVKVNFAEWTESGTLRQPSIQAFVDLPPDQCVREPGTEPHSI
ncbi:DNA ligase [Brevibacillus sp. GCM10020057]|uniref:ATP-dependent DNA ligase n=1 Tax=Brevibacillus sp. GCM10020057 TaxID=3317327 RepID=UPI00363FDDEE